MGKLRGCIGVVASVMAVASLSIGVPKLVAILLTIALLPPTIQILVAVLLAFSGLTGLVA